MSEVRLQATVSGRVQGVSFRYYTQRTALSLGLTGWVRNESNGDVRLVAEGEREKLEELLEFVQEGPSYARVSGVEFGWGEATGEFGRFQIIH